MPREDLIYEILSAVGEIPEGRVATYGQIARLIGRDRNSRLVGKVLGMANLYGEYPCHRVVNHAGRLAPGWPEQRFLLEAEQVVRRCQVRTKRGSSFFRSQALDDLIKQLISGFFVSHIVIAFLDAAFI